MSRGPDAATLLERALLVAADAAGCPVAVVASDWTRWASATFTGARHSLTLTAAASPGSIAGWWAWAKPNSPCAIICWRTWWSRACVAREIG